MQAKLDSHPASAASSANPSPASTPRLARAQFSFNRTEIGPRGGRALDNEGDDDEEGSPEKWDGGGGAQRSPASPSRARRRLSRSDRKESSLTDLTNAFPSSLKKAAAQPAALDCTVSSGTLRRPRTGSDASNRSSFGRGRSSVRSVLSLKRGEREEHYNSTVV